MAFRPALLLTGAFSALAVAQPLHAVDLRPLHVAGAETGVAAPVWSPTGTQIAFASYALGGSPPAPTSTVLVVDAPAMTHAQVFVGLAAVPCGQCQWISDPTWSPDGTQIAVVESEAIWAASISEPQARFVASGCWPDWSADGTRIAYATTNGIHVAPASGGAVKRLTTGSDRQPAWSPDGQWIAFARDGCLWRVAASGCSSEPVRITSGGSDDRQATWSPDGRFIAFASDRGGAADIWIVGVSTGQLSRLTDDVCTDSDPDWSPDGTKIVFVSNRDGRAGLWIADDLRLVAVAPASWSAIKSRYR